MKTNQILIFFSIVIVIYSLANLYLITRGIKALPEGGKSRLIVTLILIFLALTFIAGKILERTHSGILSDGLNIIGGFYLAFLLFGFLFVLLFDIILVINTIGRFLDPDGVQRFRQIYMTGALAVSIVLIFAGFINAVSPRITKYTVNVGKQLQGIESMKVMAVSDIHLGSTIRKRSMRKLSSMIKEQKPDLLLLLGDIVDGEIEPVLRDDLLSYLECSGCNYGIYAITGNHEFIGGADRTIPYIESKGYRLLKDEVVITKEGLQIVGRIDRDGQRFMGKARMPLSDLISQTDPSKPVILLDHQPYKLDESAKYGVDLHLSGHTHNGQFWPFSLIVSSIFELPYGYLKKGDTNIIVSSGFGVWGPRVRIGSRSEVVLIEMKFSKN